MSTDTNDAQVIIDGIVERMPKPFWSWGLVNHATAILVGLACFPLGMIFQTAKNQRFDFDARLDGERITQPEKDAVRARRKAREKLEKFRNTPELNTKEAEIVLALEIIRKHDRNEYVGSGPRGLGLSDSGRQAFAEIKSSSSSSSSAPLSLRTSPAASHPTP